MKKQTSDLTKELPIDYKPSIALTNYLELCSEPRLAAPYMQKITQEDYLWRKYTDDRCGWYGEDSKYVSDRDR